MNPQSWAIVIMVLVYFQENLKGAKMMYFS